MENIQLIDVIDQKGKLIGKFDSETIHKKGLLHKAVHILVVDDKDRLFIRRRARNKKLYPGVLSSSVGSHIFTGNTEEQTTKEKLKTFLGLELPVICIGDGRVKDNVENELITIYLCKSNSIPNLNPQQSDEGNFMELDEIKELIKSKQTTPHLALAIKTYENYKSKL